MLQIIKRRETITGTHYERSFEWNNCPGAGFGFPCNEKGKVIEPMNSAARENLNKCLNGEYSVSDKGIRQWTHTYHLPAIARCLCGHEIELVAFTNTCEKCNRDYNMSGQELAPRSQWGEETGETYSDILSIGHHIS